MNEKKEGSRYYTMSNPDLTNDRNEDNEVEVLRDSIATSSQVILNGYNRLEGTFSSNQKTIANELNFKPNIEKIIQMRRVGPTP